MSDRVGILQAGQIGNFRFSLVILVIEFIFRKLRRQERIIAKYQNPEELSDFRTVSLTKLV